MINCAAVVSFALLALAGQAQSLGLTIEAGQVSSGSLCDAFTCTPAPMVASAGARLACFTRGATFQPHALLIGQAQPVCVTFPGASGALIAQPVFVGALPLLFGRFYSSGFPHPCGGWLGVGRLDVPVELVAGTRFLIQALSLSPDSNWNLVPTFSNAVAITIR